MDEQQVLVMVSVDRVAKVPDNKEHHHDGLEGPRVDDMRALSGDTHHIEEGVACMNLRHGMVEKVGVDGNRHKGTVEVVGHRNIGDLRIEGGNQGLVVGIPNNHLYRGDSNCHLGIHHVEDMNGVEILGEDLLRADSEIVGEDPCMNRLRVDTEDGQ